MIMNKNTVIKKTIWRSKFENMKYNVHPEGLCNICGILFKPSSRYVRYCDSCREESEVYKHAGWAIYS